MKSWAQQKVNKWLVDCLRGGSGARDMKRQRVELQCNINMKDSELGDLKTDAKGKLVQKVELNFDDLIFQGRKFRMKFFPWIRTHELKKTLIKQKYNDKYKHLTEKDIRLFYKNIEMDQEQKNPFDIYKIEDGSTIVIMKNSNSHNLEQGVINPYKLFEVVPQELTNLILNVQSGLNAGRKPKLASEGTSGTYFLETYQKKKAAVYKPYDEEPYTPNNPRGYPGEVGCQGIRKGILSGECATRQVAAYLLDAQRRFHGVPPTTYVQFYHPCFIFKELCDIPIVSQPECNLHKAKTKHGSLQEFVEYNDVVGNLGSHQFEANEVHKIAILDLRILNCDRNEANILVVKKLTTGAKGSSIKTTSLIPIDHGLSFPDNFEIYDYQIVWMSYKQSKMPLLQTQLNYIDSIDPVKDCQTLREKLGFREICLRNFRIAQMFLKRLAKEGFTLYEIGKFAYRQEDQDWQSSDEGEDNSKEKRDIIHSDLQKLVMEAEFIYNTVKSNGIKSTAEFQMDIIKNKKQEEGQNANNQLRDITSQEGLLGLPFTKRPSRIKETSIEQKDKVINESKGKRPRNISLPNLKKKTSNRDRRLRMKKKKVKDKGLYTKQKQEKWGDLFFHYFQELLERFVSRKLDMKNGGGKEKFIPRGRLMSQDVDH